MRRPNGSGGLQKGLVFKAFCSLKKAQPQKARFGLVGIQHIMQAAMSTECAA